VLNNLDLHHTLYGTACKLLFKYFMKPYRFLQFGIVPQHAKYKDLKVKLNFKFSTVVATYVVEQAKELGA